MTHKSRLASLNESIKCFLLSNGCVLSLSARPGSGRAAAGWRSSPPDERPPDFSLQNQAAGWCLQPARPPAPSLPAALAGCPQASGAARWPRLGNCSLISYHFHKQLTAETPAAAATLPSTAAPGPAPLRDTRAAAPGQGRSRRGAETTQASSLEQRAMRCPRSAAPRRVWMSPLGWGRGELPSQAGKAPGPSRRGAPGPSAAELEEAVDLLQDVDEALVFGGAGGQGALRGGRSPVN